MEETAYDEDVVALYEHTRPRSGFFLAKALRVT